MPNIEQIMQCATLTPNLSDIGTEDDTPFLEAFVHRGISKNCEYLRIKFRRRSPQNLFNKVSTYTY